LKFEKNIFFNLVEYSKKENRLESFSLHRMRLCTLTFVQNWLCRNLSKHSTIHSKENSLLGVNNEGHMVYAMTLSMKGVSEVKGGSNM